ncbi:MAG TPA: NAD(P)/FAD-dependent oxidoreductase [Acidisarcina sp.]
MSENGRKQVVIVGGGFAGLNCAQRLAAHGEFQITLLDKNNYQQFQPLLYQVATGVLSPDNAAFNLRAVLAIHKNVDIKMTEIVSVDLATRTAHSSNGDEYRGDYLVLAAGAEANFFGIPSVAKYACPLYSLLDAEQLRSRLLEMLEAADRTGHKEGADPIRIVVIGGGPTGVETAGAIADLFQRTPEFVFKDTDLKRASVTLIDMATSVLMPFTRKAQEYTSSILSERGVQLRLGASVSEVTASGVVLSDGTHLPAGLVIWAGGLKASKLSASLGIKPGRGGRVDVKSDLTVDGFPGVYALGDFANFKQEDGSALPQLASVAQQAGRHCATNIAAAAAGETGTPFKYHDKGIMAMVGRNAAVAEVGSSHHTLTGPLAFAAWLGVHALLLTTARARLETFFEWGWEYFGHVHVAPILDRPSVNWSPESTPPSN